MLAVTGDEPFLAARGHPTDCKMGKTAKRRELVEEPTKGCKQSTKMYPFAPKVFRPNRCKFFRMAGTTRLELATSAVTVHHLLVTA